MLSIGAGEHTMCAFELPGLSLIPLRAVGRSQELGKECKIEKNISTIWQVFTNILFPFEVPSEFVLINVRKHE